MQKQVVTFLSRKPIPTEMAIPGAFIFKPNGKLRFLQRLAWKFLSRSKALGMAHDRAPGWQTYTVDADSFMERIARQQQSLIYNFDVRGTRLLIGSEDYAEIMNSKEARHWHFTFDAKYHKGFQLMGMQVEVIPWMRGVLVMP